MFALNGLLASALLATTALGHFTLDYPASRGFIDDKATEFCGGFNSVGTRQPFPLGKAPLWIDSHHKTANVAAYLSTNPNPQGPVDFNATANGTEIPMVTNWFQVPQGNDCWNVDLGALNIGLKNRSEVTLLIEYSGGDGSLYQCADLVLLDNYNVPANETCTSDAAVRNSTEAAPSTSGAAGSSTSGSPSAPAASPSKSGNAASRPAAYGAVGLLTVAAAFVAL